MPDIQTIINTCQATIPENLRVMADYSHIIPIVLSLTLGIFVFVKAKKNLFSKIFLSFVSFITLWLAGDVIIWTSNDYHLIYSIWSFLDLIEIIFFILGLYFAFIFVKEKDLNPISKIGLLLLAVPALYITIEGQSVVGFNHAVCEADNSSFLTTYKLVVESFVGIFLLIYIVRAYFKEQPPEDKKADMIVLGAMFIFLTVFGGTEYFASVTGVYEVNLYSLFLLPVFLVVIIYAVFELDIFHFKMLGTHYLVTGMVVLMGGQLFFMNGTTDQLLTILTVLLSIGLSIILFRNLKKRIRSENIH